MNHSKMDTTSGVGVMIPFLHFSGGDYVWLSVWTPSSRGQIAAACVGLFIMAVFERLVGAMRTMFDLHWHTRALAIDTARDTKQASNSKSRCTPAVDVPPSSVVDNNIELQERETSPTHFVPSQSFHLRTIPPFVAEHDIPRGILFAFQMFIGYLLMLAIMTFHGAYLISVVLGLGVGQALFGRMSRAGAVH